MDLDAVVIPGGFGSRGIEGKIVAAEISRKNNIPCLGICLGMQVMAIEFARNVLKLKDANSIEFSKKTKNPVITLIENMNYKQLGHTMRLGDYYSKLSGNKLKNIYTANKQYDGDATYEDLTNYDDIVERHRHRYEFNNKYIKAFNDNGMFIDAVSSVNALHDKTKFIELVEIINYNRNLFYIGCQFHPEFKSRPGKPHPLFNELIKQSIHN
jgi:CTP synthase